MRSFLAGLALLLSCTTTPGGAGGVGSSNPLRGITLQKVDIALSAPPVSHYGGVVAHEPTPMEAAIGRALGQLPMQPSPALGRVARELARTTPDHTNVPAALTDGLMAWAGLPDPHPRFIMIELPEDNAGCARKPGPGCDDAVASLVDQVQTTIADGEALYYGVGVARNGGGTRMIVAVVDRMVELDQMPTSVARGETVAVVGTLVGDRHRPSVEVVDPRGHWERVQTSLSVDGSFSAQLQCGTKAGPYQVEVLADGRHGIEVAANFRVFCGTPSPTRLRVEIERVEDSVDAEQIAQASLHYLNEERQRRGLAPVAWDEGAAGVAVQHSRDMANNGFFGHRSPTTGDVSMRFARAGINVLAIRENLARGYGPKGMHESLMASPAHRENILAPDMTHVGIGCVEGAPEGGSGLALRPVFCTQNFVKQIGAGAPPDRKLVPTLRAKVDELRSGASLPPAQWDRGLDQIAGNVARAIAAGRKPPAGWEQQAFDLGYGSVERHQVRTPDFDALSTLQLWSQPVLAAGIGIARVRDRDGDAFLLIVLMAEKEALSGFRAEPTSAVSAPFGVNRRQLCCRREGPL
jgi:uncharacterized protein YkwD